MNEIKKESFWTYEKSNGINQSKLVKLARSPKTLQYYLLNKEDEEETKSMIFGALVHSLILAPETVEDEFLFEPDGVDGRTKDGKAWRKHLEDRATAENKRILKEADHRRGISVAESILNDPVASSYFQGMGENEISLYGLDEETGLLKKARVDRVPKGDFLLDIKTTKDASPSAFRYSIREYKYYLQAAYYLDLYEQLKEKKDYFVFVAVEKEPPYACGVYYLNSQTLEEGRKEYKSLLQKYKRCIDTNIWPGYTEKPEELGIYIPQEKSFETI